jgi:hypothetical protein
MDHAEARELLDIAALEPGGLDRLMAGDTQPAISLAGHLAGCTECTDEFARLRRSASILRAVISTQPPAELRERTLAFVAAVGRPRGEEVAAVAAVAPAKRPRGPMSWIAAAAAIVLVSVGLTAFAVGSQKDAAARQVSLELTGLAQVAQWTTRLDAQPDVRHVVLMAAAPNGMTEQVGSLVFSAATHKMVVVADGLAEPADGQEYRCWVDVGGNRQRLGKMYVSGDLGYWVGDSDALPSVVPGSTFGVSLVNIATDKAVSPPVMSGTLQAT